MNSMLPMEDLCALPISPEGSIFHLNQMAIMSPGSCPVSSNHEKSKSILTPVLTGTQLITNCRMTFDCPIHRVRAIALEKWLVKMKRVTIYSENWYLP